MWRAVRAEILCAQGCFDDAVVRARDAVAVAAATDLALEHAEACLALGRVLVSAGDAEGANGARDAAEALYAAKEVAGAIGRVVEPVVPAPPPAPASSRLVITNRADEAANALTNAMREHDVDGAARCFSDGFVYDDRRRLSGDLIRGGAALREAAERILEQYSYFEQSTLSVRGERLQLGWSRWSNDAGYETTHLDVYEVGDDGGITYDARFDEDDFGGAYRELDRRYYAGEGAAFAESGVLLTDIAIALVRGQPERVFGELSVPELRFESRSRSNLPDRTVAELLASFEELKGMVSSMRQWYSAVCWQSRNWFVARQDREAVGRDGEKFEWTRLYVGEIRNGLARSVCDFDLEDEEAAFAYAEERVQAASSRLAVTNQASESVDAASRALQAHDVDGVIAVHSAKFVCDDRRRLSGGRVEGLAEFWSATERVIAQYKHFDWRTLAVRGDHVALAWGRWWDDAGNEASHLAVLGVEDDGRISYHARFDVDDFEGAYRELEQCYYTGEGAAFAEGGAVGTDWFTTLNRGDLDRLFGELASPNFRLENRSRSVFPDRSAAEFRASLDELFSMVSSARMWNSVVCSLSPEWAVARHEREAVGRDGELYA